MRDGTRSRDALLAEPQIAVVATTDAAGRTRLTPVWYEWDGAAFTFHFEAGARKLEHLVANPAMVVCVDRRSYPYAHVTADCVAAVGEALPGWPEPLAARYLAGDDLRTFLELYGDSPCVVVRATPQRWRGRWE